jgi:hypothetical protein
MPSAKDIVVKPISAKDARRIVRRLHYSGKVVANSCLHLGVFLHGKCEGAMQFGSPLDKRKVLTLVDGTKWNGMLELNRMAFSDTLPRNSESRAMAVAFRLIKKHYPHVEWVLSFSDGTQCGDGTIYRAAGFVLTGVKKNTSILRMPDGKIVSRTTYTKGPHILDRGGASIPEGAERLSGYQLRYIYFLNKSARDRLAVPVIPFSKIDEMGAGMYRGERVSISQRREKQAMAVPTAQRRCDSDLHAPKGDQIAT